MTERLQLTLNRECWAVLHRGEDGQVVRLAAFSFRKNAEMFAAGLLNCWCERMPLYHGSDGRWYQAELRQVACDAITVSDADA